MIWLQLFWERLSEKVHATILKGIVGGFWVQCSSKKFEKMVREAMDLCLKVLRKATKLSSTATVSGTVYWSYPILPFGIVVCTFFSDNLSQNSCIIKLEATSYYRLDINLGQPVIDRKFNWPKILYLNTTSVHYFGLRNKLTQVILPGAWVLEITVTSCPARFKVSTKALPINPVPPPGRNMFM